MNKGKTMCRKNAWFKTVVTMAVLVVLVLMMPLTVSAGEATTGTIGDNKGITWTYDADTKTLTLTGEDSGLKGEWDEEAQKTVSELYYIANGEFQHIVLENCTIKGDANSMFAFLEEVESITFKAVDTSEVTDMGFMFTFCESLTSLEWGSFSTENVTDMCAMFQSCKSLTSLDLRGFNTENVKDMSSMFNNCEGLISLDLSNFNTENVTNMDMMFGWCESLTSLNLSNFNTENVINMGCMFGYCKGLTSLDLSGFNTENVINMGVMFVGCISLTDLNISNFCTKNVEYMMGMFMECSKLTSLDLGNFELSDVVDTDDMFRNARKIKTIKTPKVMSDNLTIQLCDVYLDEQGTKHTILSKDNCNMTLVREPSPFVDVAENSWQYEYVKYALNNNLMKGKDTDANGNIIFDPNTEMTRAEFVQTLYNKEGKPQVTYTDKFPDVAADKWYTNAILWAAENKIVAGKGDGNFDVNGKITRQEMATILYKYANYKGYNTTWRTELTDYTDAGSISSWAVENMKWAISVGVMKGKGERLAPLDNATRAECATMLCNFITSYQ